MSLPDKCSVIRREYTFLQNVRISDAHRRPEPCPAEGCGEEPMRGLKGCATPGAQTMCNGYISYADFNGGITVIPPTGPQSLQTLDPLGLGVNSAVLDLTNRH